MEHTMFASTARRRVLVVSNETVGGDVLHAVVCRSAQDAEVLVVAPALNSRLRHWTSDDDRARLRAAARVRSCLDELERLGVDADGTVGDSDPMTAVADALCVFPADEIIIATHPEHRSNWLAHGLVERACERFDLPVLHVVVQDAAVPPEPALALVA
jgi:hypothetical protein